ncbi:MAG: ABC transporter substrate-binding protein, partial [Deltaproteobacteria bacterium]|nr:ABC transporter substrate-binding protein [Deltaproteobacteria bacterium]
MSMKIWRNAINFVLVIVVMMIMTQSAESKELTKIVVGQIPGAGVAKFYIAKEQGFFKDEGLDVEFVDFMNSADGLAAIRAGKIDTGSF